MFFLYAETPTSDFEYLMKLGKVNYLHNPKADFAVFGDITADY
jgi:hypothetical protein